MCGINRTVPAETDQDAEKVRQRKKTVIWFVLFIWLNQTNQMNRQCLTGWSFPTN